MSDESDYESDYEAGATSVFLGFADDPADNAMTALNNHLGGQPIWLHPDSAPDAKLIQCKNCHAQLRLLTQISAPLVEAEFYDRVLYVFACVEPKCRRVEGSIRALRAIKRDHEQETALKQQGQEAEREAESKKREQQEKAVKVGNDLFSVPDSANPFAAASPSSSLSNPFASSSPFQPIISEAEKKDKQKEKVVEAEAKNTTGADLQSVKYSAFNPCYYIDVDSEMLEEAEPIDMSRVEMVDENADDPDFVTLGKGGSTGDAGKDELINAVQNASEDKTFLHFAHVLKSNPEQVVRYEPQTLQPLLYNNYDKTAKALAKLPSDKRLELQIMPHAILLLEPHVESLADGMEWGSIFVATSVNDKDMPTSDDNGVGYMEEWCGVQWEEDMQKK